MVISKALIKHGYSNFSLEILEYCLAEKCLEREQHYLDLRPASLQGKPEYNILKVAGSLLGFKHPETSKIFKHLTHLNSSPYEQEKKSEALKIYNSSPAAKEHLKGLHEDLEIQAKVTEHLKRLHANPEHKEHLKRLNSIKSQQVSVLDSLTNERTVYPSIRGAAVGIGINPGSLLKAFNRKKGESSVLIKNKRYLITKLSK